MEKSDLSLIIPPEMANSNIVVKNESTYIESQADLNPSAAEVFASSPRLDGLNKLSGDPAVLTSEDYQKVSKIKLKTIEDYQAKESPQSSPKRSKDNLFAPINGVYSQHNLLTHAGLASTKDIHFKMD